jgi:hypothetical protein
MKNRKYWVVGATMALVTISSPAVAATLSNGSGQSCGDAIGVWHFVNNQTGGAAAGTLTATFSDGSVWTVNPTAINQNVQHFYVESAGTLVSATSTLGGRLVLSDFSCEDDGEKK